MNRHEQVLDLVRAAVGQINGINAHAPLRVTPDTVVMGESAELDSLGFVTMVSALEDSLAAVFGVDLSVFDLMLAPGKERWTIATLATHVAERLGEAAASPAGNGI